MYNNVHCLVYSNIFFFFLFSKYCVALVKKKKRVPYFRDWFYMTRRKKSLKIRPKILHGNDPLSCVHFRFVSLVKHVSNTSWKSFSDKTMKLQKNEGAKNINNINICIF